MTMKHTFLNPELNNILPGLVGDPISRLGLFHLFQSDVTLEEEVQLGLWDQSGVLLEFDAHLEGKTQFVFLEKTSASVIVNVHCKSIDNIRKAFLKYRVRK